MSEISTQKKDTKPNNDIIKWLVGKDTKSIYVKTLSIALIIFFVTLIYCAYVYPIPFSFNDIQISYLGERFNSEGYLVFSVGFIVVGLLMVPHCLFFLQKLLPDLKLLSQICVFLLMVSSIGLSLVGIFPADGIYSMHIVAAMGAIGGIAFSAILLIPVMIKKYRSKTEENKAWNYKLILVIYAIMFAVIIFGVIACAIPIIKELLAGTYIAHSYPPLWPITEWLIFFASVIFLFGAFFATPKNK
jgi:hypothetical membrane protein